jgi:hypothetical protein
MADELKALIFAEEWDRLPIVLVKLLPHFNEFKITKFTRSEAVWAGSHMRLLREQVK